MATRYYLSVNAPGAVYHGAACGVWHGGAFVPSPYSPVQYTMRLWPSTTNAGLKTTRTLLTNLAYWRGGPADVLYTRWVTPALAAQTVSGTLDLCALVQGYWSTNVVPTLTHEAQAVYKVHAYIAEGQTTIPRHVLLDNLVDGTLFPSWDSVPTWRRLTTPATLTSGATQAGDVIVVELGVRVLSSPDHTPHYNNPDDLAVVKLRMSGAAAADADATAGETATARNPWLEFSATLVEQPAPDPPANDAVGDAIVVTSLPYHSPVIDASTSTDTNQRVWWTVTIPETGQYCFHLFGTTGGARLIVSGPGVGGAPAREPIVHRNLGFVQLATTLTGGNVYTVYVESFTATSTDGATNGPVNGAVRFGCFKVSAAPQIDDLFLPSSNVYQFRDGVLVNVQEGFRSYVPTGVAFDYSGQPVVNQSDASTHTGHRLLLAAHAFDEIDLLDPASVATWQAGSLDYSYTALDSSVPTHPCQLDVAPNGTLYVGFFGDGYLTTCGVTAVPTFLSAVSDVAGAAVIRRMSAATGENQPDAPTYTALPVSIEHTAPWAIALDAEAGVLYYTSSSCYVTVAGATDRISRWDTVNDVQLTDFATLTVLPSSAGSGGLKGLAVLPGGGLLVCNGPVVQRLTASGVVSQTYTPSGDAYALMDVALTADGLACWTVDLWSTRLFKFDLTTGAELMTVQPYAYGIGLSQIALYQPEGITVPPPIEPPPVEPPLPGAPGYHLEARYIRRLRRAPHVNNENLRVFYRRFELDLERGQALASGQGSEPYVLLRLSRDGGQTWGEEMRMAAGKLGEYQARVMARRLGQARDTVFEVVVSDPVAWSLVGAWLDLEPGTS